MEKKTTATYVIQITVILLFFAILCFPLALMALDGPDTPDADKMSESTVELVPLTVETYLDGSFHSNFEAWFSHYYPLRSSVVTTFKDMLYRFEMSKPAIAVMNALSSIGDTYQPGQTPSEDVTPGTKPSTPDNPNNPDNPDDPDSSTTKDPMAIYFDEDNMYAQINLKRYEETPVEPKGYKGSDRVYIGKSGYLFESAYIDEYYGFTAPYNTVTQEGIETLVERLQYIQDELAERYGITMLYVLSSSKASQYSEYIPDYYKNRYIADPNYIRPVDRLRPLLAESTINYLDSSAYYQEIGLLATFPKTGIHWNHVASFETTAELIRMYAEISGNEVKLLDTKGVISSSTPPAGGNSEQDVYNILYGALGDVPGKIVDDAYYSADIVVKNPEAEPINIFIQGGSFTSEIMYYLNTYGVGGASRVYYNGNSGSDTWSNSSNPWTHGIYVWEDILEDLDLIIFEQTEQQVRGGHASGDNWQADSNNGTIGSNAVYDSLYMFLKETE